jgi:D-arabinose 1-dehydrogenase-like Zn-dependent alcohol dehydrogenase
MTEQVPLDETGAAFERMQSSKARFRMVVDMTSDR